MKKDGRKEYILTGIVQVLIIALHAIGSLYAFKLEAIVLAPLKYIMLLGVTLLCVDIICVLIIFRKRFKKDGTEDSIR